MALGRSLPVNDNLQFLSKSKSSILSHNEIVLKADGYERTFLYPILLDLLSIMIIEMIIHQ